MNGLLFVEKKYRAFRRFMEFTTREKELYL